MRYIKQGIAILSFWAVVWLMSANEFGSAGSWAKWCASGMVLIWSCVFAYATWKERVERRRQERKRERIAKRIIDQADKEFYLRNVA